MTRQDYMDHKITHEQYYGQYVTEQVTSKILHLQSRILESTDPHFNDVPLRLWDMLVPTLPHSVVVALKANGDFLSLGTGVCILKQAARLLRDKRG